MPHRITRLKNWVGAWAHEFPSSITLNIDLGFFQVFLMIRVKRFVTRQKLEKHTQ